MLLRLALVAGLLATGACAGIGGGAGSDTTPSGDDSPVVIADPAFTIDIAVPTDGQTIRSADHTLIAGEYVSALVDVERVDVALVQRGEECAWWSARKDELVGRACDAPLWNEVDLADGTWALALDPPLPPGEWTAMAAGNGDFDITSGRREVDFVVV